MRTQAERTRALEVAMVALPSADFEVVSYLVGQLAGLAQTEDDQRRLKEAVLAAMSESDPSRVVGFAHSLATFTLTATERREPSMHSQRH